MSERLGRGVLSLSKLKWEVTADGLRRRKAGSRDDAPDYFGTLAIEVSGAQGGEAIKMRLAGWARKSKKTGAPYMEVSLEYDRDEVRRLALALAATEERRDDPEPTEEGLEDLPF